MGQTKFLQRFFIMNEIISSILDAEKKAEDMIATANENAKIKKQNIEEEVENVKSSAVLSFSELKNKEIEKAEKKAEAEYDKIIKEAEIKVKEYKDSVLSKTESVVDELIKVLIK